MKYSQQEVIVNYSATDLYEIVLDIEKYPEFIPWCNKIIIKSQKKNKIIADMIVKYKFLFSQILGEGDRLGEFGVRKDVFEQLEVLFSESNGQGLNQSLGKFFSTLQDLSSNPPGLPERSNVIAEAQNLKATFNKFGESIFQIQRNLDAAVKVETVKTNNYISEIAELNRAIHAN